MIPNACGMCQAVADARAGKNTHLVQEFENSYLLVGSHQLFPGYCVLVSKDHLKEPFDAPEAAQSAMFGELMKSAKAIERAFAPWKINYSCYGNQVPHVHWHVFPRYESDPLLKQTPWAQSAEFDKHATTPAQAREVASKIRAALDLV